MAENITIKGPGAIKEGRMLSEWRAVASRFRAARDVAKSCMHTWISSFQHISKIFLEAFLDSIMPISFNIYTIWSIYSSGMVSKFDI